MEHVRPVLVVNKVDRVLREQGLTPEQCYDAVATIIDAFNTLVEAYQPDPAVVGSWRVGEFQCPGAYWRRRTSLRARRDHRKCMGVNRHARSSFTPPPTHPPSVLLP